MSTARQNTSFKFRGGSFHALVVKPENPISGWLADVDALLSRSPGFFAGKSVVIDLSGLTLTRHSFLALLDELSKREIRILGVEGADPSSVDEQVPFLTRGRADTEAATTPANPTPAPTFTRSCLSMLPYVQANLLSIPKGM
jgi:septum site-determining protein MinC